MITLNGRASGAPALAPLAPHPLNWLGKSIYQTEGGSARSFKPSLCENPVLSTVKSLIFNAATAARVAFSHGLSPC